MDALPQLVDAGQDVGAGRLFLILLPQVVEQERVLASDRSRRGATQQVIQPLGITRRVVPRRKGDHCRILGDTDEEPPGHVPRTPRWRGASIRYLWTSYAEVQGLRVSGKVQRGDMDRGQRMRQGHAGEENVERLR